MKGPDKGLTEGDARKRAKYLTGLLWHTGAFVIVNGFFWILDAATDGGITWAFWVTLFWGFALAFHALAFLIDGQQLEARKTAEYLQQEESGHQQD